MACRRCQEVDAVGCLCAFEDSDCISITGAGTADNPYVVEDIVDPNPLNLFQCGVDGKGVFLPDELRDPPRCQIIRSTDQSIPTSSVTTVVFGNTATYDTDGMFNNASPSRMTILTDGLYIVHAQVGFDEPSADAHASFTVKHQPTNTGFISTEIVIVPGPGAPHWRSHSSNDWEFSAGDYIEIEVFQNTGGALNMIGARLTARWVAPLS